MTPVRAVLVDAMGTLLELDLPVARLRATLRDRAGLDVSEPDAARALATEIAYYRAHHLDGRDAAGLADLRDRCAAVLAHELGPARADPAAIREALLDALRFRAHPDAAPALRALREAGAALVALSNWDVSLHVALAETGLAGLLDGAVSSAEAGAAKPDPAPFRAALAIAGVPAGAALHVGDDMGEDVEGARAAGIEPILLVRGGVAGGGGLMPAGGAAPDGRAAREREAAPAGVLRVRDLGEVAVLVARRGAADPPP